MAALVSIGGFDFPEPSTYNATTSTIVDSARNVIGYVVGAVVRHDVAKIEMSWKILRISLRNSPSPTSADIHLPREGSHKNKNLCTLILTK